MVRCVHRDGVAQRRGQAVQQDRAGEAVAVAAQGVHAPGLAQFHALSRRQDLVQKVISGPGGCGSVPLRECGERLAAGDCIGLSRPVADDGPVVQGRDGQVRIQAGPVKVPDAGQAVLIPLTPEVVIVLCVQIQSVLHAFGDAGQRFVRSLLRSGGRQCQSQGHHQGQSQRKQLLHRSSLHVGSFRNGDSILSL